MDKVSPKSRIRPAAAPYSEAIQAQLASVMRGRPPLLLFTTLARDERLFWKFMRGSLLDAGHLTLRQREMVIDRTVANCGSSYEWGVHIAFFSRAAKLDTEAQRALALNRADMPSWTAAEVVLIKACDELHDTATIGDELWSELSEHYSEVACLEIIMLVGFYHTVAFLTNALKLPDESFGTPLPRS